MEIVELSRRITLLVPMDLSAMGSQGNCSWCGISGHMARDCRNHIQYLPINQTRGWSGTGDKGKGELGMDKGKGNQDKGRMGTTTRQTLEPVKITHSGRTRVGITLTTAMTRRTLPGNQRHDCWLAPPQLAQEQSIQRTEGGLQMLGGLSMYDQRQQHEQ